MADDVDLWGLINAASSGQTGSSGSDDESFWNLFAKNMYGQRGNLEAALGTYQKGVGYGTYFESMATQLGLQAGAAGMQADWAQFSMVFPELQQKVINIQTSIQKKESLEKWLGRVSATKTRYAKAGVVIDSGGDTPMKSMLTLLESSQEELQWLEVGKKVREFNEVFMPGIEAKVKESSAQYQQELYKINQNLAITSGNIQRRAATTQALIKAGSSVVSAYGAAYDASKK